MKATSTLIDSPRFPVERSGGNKANPPPGKHVAQALLDDLLATGRAVASRKKLENKDYNHASWYFDFDFENDKFQIFLEGNVDVRKATLWRVCMTRVDGIMGALHGNREALFEVPDDCLKLLQESICRVFGVSEVRWLDEEEAAAEFRR
ncbi:MAG TPA: hypothetical protein VGM54_06800 [Chthoniobacter sp.]|jgi:hypothetical protein